MAVSQRTYACLPSKTPKQDSGGMNSGALFERLEALRTDLGLPYLVTIV
jgi:hypothetical protein